MDNFVIRRAIISDIQQIQILSKSLIEYEYTKLGNNICNLNWPMSMQAYNNFRRLIQTGIFLVAECDSQIVGYICGEICPKEPSYSVQFAELINLYVLEGYRGIGVASQLITSFKNTCRMNNIRYIKLYVLSNNKEAIECYQKRGFNEYIKELLCKLD